MPVNNSYKGKDKMKQIPCPNCGHMVPVPTHGRKRKDIDFSIVSREVREAMEKGLPMWTSAAGFIERDTGIKVSPAFVMFRMRRAAEEHGLTLKMEIENLRKEVTS